MELLNYDSSGSNYYSDHSSDEDQFYSSSDGEAESRSITHRAARQYRSRNVLRKEKTLYFEKNASLLAQRANLERDLRLQFFETKVPALRQAAAQASNDSRAMDMAYQKESRALATQLLDFRNKTNKLKKQLQRLVEDQDPTTQSNMKSNDVASLHVTFDHLENDISTFKLKGRSRYQALQQQERNLTKELEEFQYKCQHWETEPSIVRRDGSNFSTPPSKHVRTQGSSRKMSKTNSSRPNSRPSIILALERKMESAGGSTGGWDSRDHATFLRLLSKYHLRSDAPTLSSSASTASSPGTAPHPDVHRRIESMLSFACTKLPSYDPAQIKTHWKWYQHYTTLVDQKRQAVKEWRDRRANPSNPSHTTTPTRTGTAGAAGASPSSYTTPEQQRTKRNNKKAATLEKLRRESEEKKKQLSAWKAARLRDELAKEEEKLNALEEEKMTRRRLHEKRHQQKEEIAMYRLQREAEAAHQKAVQKVLATARGHVRGPATSTKVIRQRHARDMRKIEAKKDKKRRDLELKKQKERKRLAITEKVNRRVTHDFNRLTRHTTASAHNALTPETLDEMDVERRAQHGGHNGRLYGHTGAEIARGRTYGMSKASTLKTPSWRRGAR